MSNTHDYTYESQRRRKLSSDKIKELESYISKHHATSAAKAGATSHQLNCNQIAASLFAKAPVEFLERKTLADLAAIAEKSLKAVEACLSRPRDIHIFCEQNEDYTCVYLALGDRPFVVNTLTECVRYFGGAISVLLHPIVLRDGHRISLSYMEVERITPAQLTLLERRLGNSMKDLMLVTDDFTSMLVRAETLARVLDNSAYRSNIPLNERREVAEFLRWLTDGSFIFLGHAEWRFDESEQILKKPASILGVFKSTQSYRTSLLNECREDALRIIEKSEPFAILKLRTETPVHRRVRMLHIVIQELSTEGRINAVHSMVGMLTSKALSQESSSVPIIRRKLQKLIEIEDVVHNSHDYKYIVDIIDSMPKDEALRMETDGLRDVIHTILGIQNRNETRVSLRFDPANRGVSVLIVMPRDRFNTPVRHKIQQHVEKAFGAPPGSSEYHLDLTNKPLARFYFYIPFPDGQPRQVELAAFQAEIAELSMTWRDALRERVLASKSFDQPQTILERYGNAFPEDYQALHSVEDCEQDILIIESLDEDSPVRVSMSTADCDPGTFTLIVYHLNGQLTLSKALPIMENSGLEVFTEKSSCVLLENKIPVFIYRFLVRIRSGAVVKPAQFESVLSPGLAQLFADHAENDALNSLMVNAGLDLRSISVLRAYCCLLWQVNRFATKRAIFDTLSSVPGAASQLWSLFDQRFNPQHKGSIDARSKKFMAGLNKFKDSLREVTDLTKDRVLRALANLLENTLRTNFFSQIGALALKIHSEKVEVMPSPRPLYEIFVRSTEMEGVHLRSSKVARGGIRWSERNDDYRREILGLMKTQKTKNALIVPEGAKGGFIIRQRPKEAEKLSEVVTAAYRQFIRACLSLADNRTGGNVVSPEGLVIYDEPDPYFVVAADKGTAAFSDVANRIAIDEFDFWLHDAFASGGSKGYDHKVYGITARGAWECVKRHFNDLKIDYVNQPFSVIGIGDMSGDVFGNGLLLSPQMKLIAAFDHRHIFLDPSPEVKSAYAERKRMFEMPRSQWTDYSKSLISKGGGVHGRFDKEIEITPQVKAALGLADDVPAMLNGEQLINHILKAPCDLLWNGGIGTYVKSSEESNSDVNDGTNDRVRISATELRARVVAEGGNLGFTQRARIEYAQSGGRINTDAIDNSGGVDLSDHEVNIKILLAGLTRSQKLSMPERDALLKEMAPEVVESVLEHNRNHALLLSVGVERSKRNGEYFQSLLRNLSKLGFVNRALENLPDDDELVERVTKKAGLCSPELAICVATVKMWAKNALSKSELLKDQMLRNFLVDYFPSALKKRFPEEILQHPLSPNIIATQVTNTLVDSIGVTFLHRMCTTHSVPPITAIKCTMAAHMLLESESIRRSLRRFDDFSHRDQFISLWLEVGNALREATSWLISYHGHDLQLGQILDLYQKSYRKLVDIAPEVLVGQEREQYQKRLDKYSALKLDDFSARSLAIFPRIVAVLEMLWTSKSTGKDVRVVAQIFSLAMEKLGIDGVLRLENRIEPNSKWESELLVSSFEEIRRSLSMITAKLIERGALNEQNVSAALHNSPSFEQLHNVIEEVKQAAPCVAALSIVARHLRAYHLS